MKKRRKNVYSESSEYHADTDVDTSVGKSLQQSPALPASSLVGYGNGSFIYVSIFSEFK